VAYFVYILSVFMIKMQYPTIGITMAFGSGAQQDGLYPGPKIWCYAPAHYTGFIVEDMLPLSTINPQ